MQAEGETAGACAAAAVGIPFTLSTLGTTSIEGVKAANPHGRNWFQLYVMRQREISYDLVRRAGEAGFDTLMFTVDTPIAGARLRDKRNGFSIPPQLTLGTILNAIPRSEEHTSELQSLMRISYAVFCLKKKNNKKNT